jgi:hypothetical protein
VYQNDWRNCIKWWGFLSSLFRNTLHTVIVDISSSRLAWRTDFFGLWRKDCLTRPTLSSDTRGCPAPRCRKLLIPTPNAVGRWGITLKLSPEGPLNRNNCSTLRKLQDTNRLMLRSRLFLFLTSRTGGGGSGIPHVIKTWIPAVSFHVGNIPVLLRAAWNRSSHFGTRCRYNFFWHVQNEELRICLLTLLRHYATNWKVAGSSPG